MLPVELTAFHASSSLPAAPPGRSRCSDVRPCPRCVRSGLADTCSPAAAAAAAALTAEHAGGTPAAGGGSGGGIARSAADPTPLWTPALSGGGAGGGGAGAGAGPSGASGWGNYGGPAGRGQVRRLAGTRTLHTRKRKARNHTPESAKQALPPAISVCADPRAIPSQRQGGIPLPLREGDRERRRCPSSLTLSLSLAERERRHIASPYAPPHHHHHHHAPHRCAGAARQRAGAT